MSKVILVVVAVSLSGCTSQQPLPQQPVVETESQKPGEVTQTWRLGRYRVRFAAGPHQFSPEGDEKSFSTYSIVHQVENEPPVRQVAGSALDIDVLIDSAKFKVDELIGLWASPSERLLLLAEDVPNDGRPCSNFILFEREGEELKFSYLKMPMRTRTVKPLKEGVLPLVFAEYPTILRLTDEKIEFQFSDKKHQHIKVRDIPHVNGLMFP